MQYKCKGLTSIVYGTVHNNSTVVDLQHIHFSSLLSTSCNSTCIIRNFTYAIMSESNVCHMSTTDSPFSSRLIMSNFS